MNTLMLATTGGSLLLAVATIAGVCIWQARKFQTYAHRVDRLSEQLSMYADASINIARSVDTLVTQGGTDKVQAQASRRWLLEEARARMANGNKLKDIAIPLGLSRDEIRLLNLTGGNRPDAVEHSH